MAGRRSSSDLEWQETKKRVKDRDGNKDRILRVLSAKEALVLKRKAPASMLQHLDVAHYFPVSIYPDLVYNTNNCVLLNRFCHENLDNMRHPITADPIDYDERQAWWARILGPDQIAKVHNTLDKT